MTRPRLLDTFCGAGGCSVGYHRAGFEVVGVDNRPMPRYPFEFHQADALEFIAEHGREFDVIHASPPCQAYSNQANCWPGNEYPDLISATRGAILQTGNPYVIENVAGARNHLLASIMLCGKTFGLKVYRHRYFECRPFFLAPAHILHRDSTPRSGRGKSPKGFISVAGHLSNTTYCREAMDIDWMTGAELSQAIPPAYTQWLGTRLLEAL